MLYDKVIDNYKEIKHLRETMALLNWDHSVLMPEAGVASRSEKMAALTKIMHSKFHDDNFYTNCCTLIESDEFNSLSENEQIDVKLIKKRIEKERKIPTDLATEMAKTAALSMAAWEGAKKSGDDSEYLPMLEKMMNLVERYADCLGYEENPYDALLNEYEEGLKYSYVEPLFNTLQSELVELLEKIEQSPVKPETSFIEADFDTDKQWDFGIEVLKDMGVDFTRFRQDSSTHPFTITIGSDDIRTTTRLDKNNFKDGFFSTAHEGGHGLYELGTSAIFGDSPSAVLHSLSLHESQSRFYENIVGRSRGFWNHYFTRLQEFGPAELKKAAFEDFYKAINKVQRSPIRVEADEATYNLHIILRTGLENRIINGKLAIRDINEAWNEETKRLLGFYPEDKKTGYLQDIHWSDGLFGYFPTYTMGNLISAQLANTMAADIGGLDSIDKDKFAAIQKWLKEKLYSKGSIYNVMDVVKDITGEEITEKYFFDYMKKKYSEIYNL